MLYLRLIPLLYSIPDTPFLLNHDHPLHRTTHLSGQTLNGRSSNRLSEKRQLFPRGRRENGKEQRAETYPERAEQTIDGLRDDVRWGDNPELYGERARANENRSLYGYAAVDDLQCPDPPRHSGESSPLIAVVLGNLLSLRTTQRRSEARVVQGGA